MRDDKQKHRFFKKKLNHKKQEQPAAPTQTVTINLTVNEKGDDESPVSGCFKMLCGAAKKAAIS
jgi:hypothetical protein